jgi:DNA (cytosine-5)-methyltransferase 1
MNLGSLFSGYGGLDLAVEAVTGARSVWHVEADPHASTVLAAHWPDVSNLGDITAVDWTQVEPVDVLAGGFPCQDISSAGLGAGIKEGNRSGLWYRYADAVRHLRPSLVVVENVRALLVRGLDIVAGDLAELGYDAQWTCVPASAVGACHRRERVFLIAWPAASHPDDLRRQWTVTGALGDHGRGDTRPHGVTPLLPTPEASDGTGGRVSAEMGGTRPSGAKRAVTLATAVHHGTDLLPTPTAQDSSGSRGRRPDGAPYGPTSGTTLTDAVTSVDWGRYADAIARHERTFARPAPHPVDDKGRLSPLLCEWMMGLPAGWITGHVGRRHALRLAGNGVVPRQAEAAIDVLLSSLALEAVS